MFSGQLRPRRIAVVLAATALVSVAGAGSAQASTGTEPTTTEDAALLATVTELTRALTDELGAELGTVLADAQAADAATTTTTATKSAAPTGKATGKAAGGPASGKLTVLGLSVPSLAETTAQLPAVGPGLSATTQSAGRAISPTAKKLPVLGPVVGGAVDGLTQVRSEPQAPAPRPGGPEVSAPVPAPAPVRPAVDAPGPQVAERESGHSGPGVTWTAPSMTSTDADPGTAARSGGDDGASFADRVAGRIRAVADLVTGAAALLPDTPEEAARATAGAATVALIVLGGIAVTGAAGAASVAGRRELVGHVGGARGMS